MKCPYCGSNQIYVETVFNNFTDTSEITTCFDCGREIQNKKNTSL